MKIDFIIFFFIWNLFNIIIRGEYYIDNKIPSYLYYKINNIKEEIFPNDIRINISLSRIDGDLLYSIDKNMNQLIVSVFDGMESAIKIQFRKKEYYVSLHKLCGCERCFYTIFDLGIQIREQIALQCNNREIEYFKYDVNKEVNEAYPVLYSQMNIDNGLPNEAHMWLVNQEQYKNIYHNPQQMLGCIFNVRYDRKEINFTRISDNIGRKCKKICVGNICNGGKCYENYNGEPVCDCTKTFLSGTYCNDTITSINGQSLYRRLFEVIKVAWKSSTKEILSLKNLNVEIRLYVDDEILFFQYKYTNEHEIYTKGILSRNYIPNREYILIITFFKTKIDIQSFTNESILKINIPTYRDLTNEIFTSLTLQSGDGFIDFYYKTSPREYIWYKVDIKHFKKTLNEAKKNSKDKQVQFVSQIKDILSRKDYKISQQENIIKKMKIEKEKEIIELNIIQNANKSKNIAFIITVIVFASILTITTILFIRYKNDAYFKKRFKSKFKRKSVGIKLSPSKYNTVKKSLKKDDENCEV